MSDNNTSQTKPILIDQVDVGDKGYFRATEDGTEAGRMTYTRAGSRQIIIDHTEVDPAFGGRNVGKKLLMEAVKYARENNIKIFPLCPFAKAMFEKIQDIRDVLA